MHFSGNYSPTFKNRIRTWFEQGMAIGATHILIIYDSFSEEDYPIYIMPEQNVTEIAKKYSHSPNEGLVRLMECYNIEIDLEIQLAQFRSKNF